MRYGEIIRACKNGFYIEPSLIKPLGISDNSHCWGVFALHETGKDSEKKFKDLIISPFPYRSWGCLVDLRIRIKEDSRMQTVLDILDSLNKNNINILSLEIMFAGESHYMMDFVLELFEFRSDIERAKNNLAKFNNTDEKHTNTNKKYTKNANRYFKIFAKKIKEKMETMETITQDIDKKYKGVLYSTNLHKKEEDKFNLKSIEWNWLHSLAHYSFFNDKTKYKFKYSVKNTTGLLTFENDFYSEEICSLFEKLNPDLKTDSLDTIEPFFVMSSFNVANQYIKLRAVSVAEHNHFYQVKIQFQSKISEITEHHNVKISDFGSRGLTHQILNNIKDIDKDFKLFYGSVGSLQRQDKKSEQGMIIINGTSSCNLSNRKEKLSDINTFKNTIDAQIEKKKNKQGDQPKTTGFPKQLNNMQLEVSKLNPYKLFLSFRQFFIEDEKTKEIIKSKLGELGFEVTISQTLTSGVTQNVMDDMEKCDACLQIYTLSDNEKEKITRDLSQDFIPDHAWMLFEYGLAMKQGMPIGRMIDVTHLPKEKWEKHLRFNKDNLLKTFTGDVCLDTKRPDSFIEGLEKLAKELMKEIMKAKA